MTIVERSPVPGTGFTRQAQARTAIALGTLLLVSACGHEQTFSLKQQASDSAETPQAMPAVGDLAATGFADLSGDALIPPAEPELSIAADVGTLSMSWAAIVSQQVARLYQSDTLTGIETLVHESTGSTGGALSLQSQTHRRSWQRQRFRLELCSADDCTSSQRVSAEALAARTAYRLRPAVFVEGEHYAENMALNRDASLLVSTLPVEGAIEFHRRVDNDWATMHRHKFADLLPASTPTLKLALSASGDTLAVLTGDANDMSTQEIRILERLGEAWLEVDSWAVDYPDAKQQGKLWLRPQIQLSAAGNHLLLQLQNDIVSYRRLPNGWSRGSYFHDSSAIRESSQSADDQTRQLASAANAEHTRLYTLFAQSQALWLGLWMNTDSGPGIEPVWRRAGTYPVTGLDALSALAIRSNAQGDAVVIAGWEKSASQERTPVMWRFAVPDIANSAITDHDFVINVMDSLRGPPTDHVASELVFDADDSLTTIAIGWQATGDISTECIPDATTFTHSDAVADSAAPDAALVTFLYDALLNRWLPALDLPATMPTLAKQAFAGAIALSADGHTLLIAAGTGQSPVAGNRVGEILVLR
jgi:hypothetical protein